MPVKYQISDKSLENRKKILAICKYEPKTLNEISQFTGSTTSALRFNVKQLMESNHLKFCGTKIDHNNRTCYAYISTDSKYIPHQEKKLQPVKSKKAVITIVTSDDYHPTRAAPKRRDAWIGSTFSTMSY